MRLGLTTLVPLLMLATPATTAFSVSPVAHAGPALAATQAQLAKPLDARYLEQAAPFYLSTTRAWQGGNCAIRANTMIQGQISALKHRKEGAKQEELGIRFEPIPCYGNETGRVTPVLIAMRLAGVLRDDRGLQEAEMKQAMMSMAATRQPRTPHGGAPSGVGANAENQNIGSFGLMSHEPENSPLKTGEVRGLHGIRMELPAHGSDVTTLLSSHAISLAQGTEFLLVFLPGSEPVAAPETAKINPASAPNPPELVSTANPAAVIREERVVAAAKAAVEQAGLCGDGCVQLETSPITTSGSAAWSLSLARMGLRPRMQQVRLDLDDDASVHFLGEDQILVTMNPHGLTRRLEDGGPRPRHIRAVVLSRQDGHLIQEQEWPVFDDRQYTWDMGDGRVLAHIAHDLVILGPDLTVSQRYHLAGPLVFAEVAPLRADLSSEKSVRVAVATVHEKHTPEAHQKLAAFFGPDWPIAEDYDLTALDTRLVPIGTRSLDVRPSPMTLLGSGMVSLQRDHGEHFLLHQENWNGTSATLAKFTSGCDMGLASIPGPLIFATACASDQGSSFYWILNDHGSVLLGRHFPATELIQQAQSSTDGSVIALAATESYDPIDLKIGATIADFRRLNLSVYRVFDGKQILAVEAAEGSALRQTFALAPSGDSLAVLSGSTLQTYRLDSRQKPANPAIAAVR